MMHLCSSGHNTFVQRMFGRAVHCLGKIGDELYIDPENDSVTFRTVNSSWSTFICFKFFNKFFASYQADSISGNGDHIVKCKVSLKACLGVFRSLSTIEKVVDKCDLSLCSNESKMIFKLHCKHNVVKTYNLPFIECETLEGAFEKDSCCNNIVAHSRLLADVAANFQTSQDEITLCVKDRVTTIKNYVDDEPDPSKVVHTVMSLEAEEFSEYNITSETEVTFCLKELRALLFFSEFSNLPVHIHFDNGGKPIIFSNENEEIFVVNFVMATLEESATSQSVTSGGIERLSQNKNTRDENENDANSNLHEPLDSANLEEVPSDFFQNDSDWTSEDIVIASPPKKKFREEKAKFLGMLDFTIQPTVSFKNSEVLAPESDED
ncbi:Cell cycle checkpoint control protein RAD9A [Nymphon striatum]|nr:Cell cycle checkpoint control protein RAD9A [Nymphon striatum]